MINLSAGWACWSASEGELLWRIDIFLFIFQQRSTDLLEEDCYFNVVGFCFISVWILVNIWLDLNGQGALANQVVSFCRGSRMVSIWLNSVPKLVTLGHSFAVNIQTWEDISRTQRMIHTLYKYYNSCEFCYIMDV